MIEINLIPDVKQELIRAQRMRSSVIAITILIGIISVAIVVILASYVFGVQTIRDNIADSSIEKGIAKLKNVDDLSKTLTIQNQLTKLSDLNKNKKISSRIFDVLSSIIPPAPDNIQISSISIKLDNEAVTIDGQAPNSYAAAEVFKKTLEGAKLRYKDKQDKLKEVDLASNIVIGDTSYGQDSSGNRTLRFTLSFNYAPELFAQSSKETTIAITVNGNVTDSYIGIPKSIFADRAADIEEEE